LRLARIFERVGLWASAGNSLRFSGPRAKECVAQAATALRARPPESLQGRRVTKVTDYSLGSSARPAYLGHQDLLSLDLEDGSRVLIRPSGTESKLKFYIHLRGLPAAPTEFLGRRAEMLDIARNIGAEIESIARASSAVGTGLPD
jgi:phosphomannomutase